MKSRLVFLFFILSIAGVFVGLIVYANWGRKLIYYETDRLAPGIGKNYSEKPNIFKAVGKADRNDIHFVGVEERGTLDGTTYDFTYIPKHTSLDRVVGYFRGLEEIQNSEDKYVLLDEGSGDVNRYRLVVVGNRLTKTSESTFYVEDVGYLRPNSEGLMKYLDRYSRNLSVEEILKHVQLNDAIVIFPQYESNGETKLDASGNVVTGSVVMRRSFGWRELELFL